MATQEEMGITLVVSTRLGVYGACLASMEPAIDEAIKIVAQQREEDSENTVIPIMMNLLVSAKDFINAHRVVEKTIDLMMSGSVRVDGSGTVQ